MDGENADELMVLGWPVPFERNSQVRCWCCTDIKSTLSTFRLSNLTSRRRRRRDLPSSPSTCLHARHYLPTVAKQVWPALVSSPIPLLPRASTTTNGWPLLITTCNKYINKRCQW
jgi:hypothetical protein